MSYSINKNVNSKSKLMLLLVVLMLMASTVLGIVPDINWKTGRNLTIQNNFSIDVGNQSIVINITGLNIESSATNEIRISNESCDNGGSFIDTGTIISESSTAIGIGFITSESHLPNTNLTYCVYYNTSTPADQNHETQLTLFDTFTDTVLSLHPPDFSKCSSLWSAGGQTISSNRLAVDGLDNDAFLDVTNCIDTLSHRALLYDFEATIASKIWFTMWDNSNSGNRFGADGIFRPATDILNTRFNAISIATGVDILTDSIYGFTMRLTPSTTVTVSVFNNSKVYTNFTGIISASYVNTFIIANGAGDAPNGGRIDNIVIWNGSKAEFVTSYFPQSTIFIGDEQSFLDTTPPIILHNTTNNSNFLEDTIFNLDYTPSDLSGISQCNLFTNITGSFIVTANDTTIINNVINSFPISVDIGNRTYLYGFSCNDSLGNLGFSGNQTFFITLVTPPSIPIDEPFNTVRDNILILYLFWAIWLFLVAMGFRYSQRDLLFFVGIIGVLLSVASIRILSVHILLRLFWISIAFVNALLIAISLREGSNKKDTI